MAKPPLSEPLATLEKQLIGALLEGLHAWRPDLHYPESYSDMQGMVRQLFKKFLIVPLGDNVSLAPCPFCGGTRGHPKLEEMQDHSWRVICYGCSSMVAHPSRSWVIAIWNDRDWSISRVLVQSISQGENPIAKS